MGPARGDLGMGPLRPIQISLGNAHAAPRRAKRQESHAEGTRPTGTRPIQTPKFRRSSRACKRIRGFPLASGISHPIADLELHGKHTSGALLGHASVEPPRAPGLPEVGVADGVGLAGGGVHAEYCGITL